MRYKVIKFTGLEIDGDDLFKNDEMGNSRFVKGVIPSDYTRIVMPSDTTKPVPEMKKWIEEKLPGKYSIYRAFNQTHFYFEEESSGVLFKLLDGAKAV